MKIIDWFKTREDVDFINAKKITDKKFYERCFPHAEIARILPDGARVKLEWDGSKFVEVPCK